MYKQFLEISEKIKSFEVQNIVKCDIKLPSTSNTFFLTVVSIRQGKDMPFCLVKKKSGAIIERPFKGGYFSTKEQCYIIDNFKK